ncbi:MAG: PKD domain-containing protein, partial [Flavobacteriales bacterium]|nr:PKD domain-containing protein [Flavobacteriales bacterium]
VPWSDFDALRTVNSFYIESELANQDSFSWDFDDGSAAETVAVNPSHTYSIPDDYDVCLTVSNSTCGARSTCHILTLPGVSGLSPSYAAPTVNFIGDVRGGGFVAGTAFVLIGEGQPDIIPTSTYVGGSTYARIMCDLSGAAAGYRDLVVMTPDEPNDTLFDALNILSDGDFVSSIGKRPDVTINGPGNIWVGNGRISEYSISFTNNTDETMLGIPVSIELPYGIVIDEIFSDIISDTTGLGEIEVFEEFYDSTAGHYRVVAFLLLSYINPGESRSIDFNLHAESPFSSNIQVKVFSSWLSSQGDVAGKSFVPSCNDAPACVQCALDAMSLIPALSCVSSLYGLV